MAAEIVREERPDDRGVLASMRPRRMAAEIPVSTAGGRRRDRRFNEAAANGRGNRGRRRTPGPRASPLQ